MKGLFVTGTDTGVGKTVVAAALMHRYRGVGPLRYWKPIQTGIEIDDDTATVRRLGGCSEDELFDQGARLSKPVSPHLAARWAGQRIDLAELRGLVGNGGDGTTWIVEGAGGVLVPVNETQTMADWIAYLALPALVVARSGLGTINHTLLTLEALQTRRLCVAGVIMIGEANADNRAAIEKYGHVPVVAEMPFLTPLDPGLLGAWSVTHLDAEFLR
ncbi:MAG TPA: dethiobiotin synthase [Bryobacteraceae bacterium]|jgi:dethiobiotin synthetase|nr:dethiobiotin synthase [Bryobacteraceae bacterium]